MIQYGVFLLMPSPSGESSPKVYARALEVALVAEQLGFHSIWIAEHHFSNYGYVPRPLVMASHIAAKTKNIRIGTGVVVLPLHHPLIVAEETAMVDILSNGRLEVGLGRGYQPYEFERFDKNLSESRERWSEGVEILQKAWTLDTLCHKGKYYQFDNTTIFPKPIQKPHPPIWMVAQSEQSIIHAATNGFDVLTGGAGFPMDTLVAFRKLFDQNLVNRKTGKIPRFGVQSKIYVASSSTEAREASQEALWNIRVSNSLRLGHQLVTDGMVKVVPMDKEPSRDELIDQYLIFGTPDYCAQKIQWMKDNIKLDLLNLDFWSGNLSHSRIIKSMERFYSKVVPLIT
jgi:luciferase family oxidoreductase group 1